MVKRAQDRNFAVKHLLLGRGLVCFISREGDANRARSIIFLKIRADPNELCSGFHKNGGDTP